MCRCASFYSIKSCHFCFLMQIFYVANSSFITIYYIWLILVTKIWIKFTKFSPNSIINGNTSTRNLTTLSIENVYADEIRSEKNVSAAYSKYVFAYTTTNSSFNLNGNSGIYAILYSDCSSINNRVSVATCKWKKYIYMKKKK